MVEKSDEDEDAKRYGDEVDSAGERGMDVNEREDEEKSAQLPTADEDEDAVDEEDGED